ncbi:hypothetical protein GETHLI_17550 [Geothrix limicola]|uniref:DUF3800 domain-containing protein n=1 Tax=Geothrix limicola TaxID=2927978 RepID=A0ABQ5QEZ9_9BACT|nr:DUF3800 domain-containing protein [Geothrix limicola]GLH73253.1 hypothetical protein GETHLI_17550 [Geothrix limicola]
MSESAYYQIYCDESCISDRYHVIGGLILNRKHESAIIEKIKTFRSSTNMSKELKWTKVKNQKREQYVQFVDIGSQLFLDDVAHFHALVIDSHQYDHKKYSAGNAETTFYKMMYQFVLHRFGKYLKVGDRFSLFLDQRSTSYSLSDFKTIMNRGLVKRYGLPQNPLRDVVPLNSKEHDLIQMADVFMGAIGFRVNGKELAANACSAKLALCAHIEMNLKIRSLAHPIEEHGFSSWHFRFRK